MINITPRTPRFICLLICVCACVCVYVCVCVCVCLCVCVYITYIHQEVDKQMKKIILQNKYSFVNIFLHWTPREVYWLANYSTRSLPVTIWKRNEAPWVLRLNTTTTMMAASLTTPQQSPPPPKNNNNKKINKIK